MSSAVSSEMQSAEDGYEPTYSFKPSLMGVAREFRLSRDGLRWELGRHKGRIPYGAIRRIRLSYRPVTLQNHRFLAEVWADGAPKLQVVSVSWRSLVEQERHDAAYKAFIRALHQRIALAGAKPMLHVGTPPWVYWPGVAVFIACAVFLPYLLLRAMGEGSLGGVAIVGSLLVLLLWQVGAFFWRNQPGSYEVDAIPAKALPRG